MSDAIFAPGGSPLSRLLGGYLPPRKKFTLDVLRCNDVGAPVTITLPMAARALSVEETEEAHAAAIQWLVSKGGHQREDLIGSTGDSILECELMVQLLSRALMDPERLREPFAKDAAALRAAFFTDEIDVCFREYSAFQAERSPLRNIRSAEELREVVDALGKGLGSSINLLRYDAISLCSITHSLAALVSTQTRPSSSDTSQPEPSPEESSEALPTTPQLSISVE